MKTQIKNYDQALQYLGGKRERPYAHNTRIERILEEDKVVILYHGSPVVIFKPESSSFSSCGWKTITTKERINWFLPEGFSCWQEKSVWYISDRNAGKRYGFADGITITHDGQVFKYAPESESETIKRQIKQIKAYINGYVQALLNGEIDQPSGGDCWLCLGNIPSDNLHIESHIEESYFVPSMVKNAHEFKPISGFAQDAIARIWQGTRGDVSEWQAGIMARDVKSSLTAYIKHCLGIAA